MAKKSKKNSGQIQIFRRRKITAESIVRAVFLALLATAIIVSAFIIHANAGGVDTVIAPLTSLKTLVIARQTLFVIF